MFSQSKQLLSMKTQQPSQTHQAALDKALITATRDGQFDKVKDLLDQGANVDARGRHGRTPLIITIEKHPEALDTIELLLNRNANVQACDDEHWTPLISALRYGNPTTIQQLLARGADVNVTNQDGWTPLMMATKYQPKGIIEALLAANAEVNVTNQNGWTPLILATIYQPKVIIEALLAANAEVNVTSQDGWTPLMVAVEYHDFEKAKIFLRADAQLTPENLKQLEARGFNRDKLCAHLIERIQENMETLFSDNLDINTFRQRLTSTNTLLNSLGWYGAGEWHYRRMGERDYQKERKSIRSKLVKSIKDTRASLNQREGDSNASEMKARMQEIANTLSIIQKRDHDRHEKSAKRALLAFISVIDPSEPAKPILKTLEAWLHRTPTPGQMEAMICSHLLNPLNQDITNELREYLTNLNQSEHQKLKDILFDHIKTLSHEFKLENPIDGQIALTIDRIKASYEIYMNQPTEAKQTPALFELLRMHQSGTPDQSTGTWKAFMTAMENGEFNRIAPANTSFFGRFFGKKQSSHDEGKELKLRPSPTSS